MGISKKANLSLPITKASTHVNTNNVFQRALVFCLKLFHKMQQIFKKYIYMYINLYIVCIYIYLFVQSLHVEKKKTLFSSYASSIILTLLPVCAVIVS